MYDISSSISGINVSLCYLNRLYNARSIDTAQGCMHLTVVQSVKQGMRGHCCEGNNVNSVLAVKCWFIIRPEHNHRHVYFFNCLIIPTILFCSHFEIMNTNFRTLLKTYSHFQPGTSLKNNKIGNTLGIIIPTF